MTKHVKYFVVYFLNNLNLHKNYMPIIILILINSTKHSISYVLINSIKSNMYQIVFTCKLKKVANHKVALYTYKISKNHWVEYAFLYTFRTHFRQIHIKTIKNRLKQIGLTYRGMCRF